MADVFPTRGYPVRGYPVRFWPLYGSSITVIPDPAAAAGITVGPTIVLGSLVIVVIAVASAGTNASGTAAGGETVSTTKTLWLIIRI